MAPRRMSEIGDESKQRLMDAAEELFLEKGFENTTVVEIGQRAGISHGSIPWHFGNKSGLLYAVVVRLFAESSSYDQFPTGQAGFDRLWHEQAYFDNSPKFPLFGSFFLSEVERSQNHRAEIIENHLERVQLISDWMQRSIDADGLTTQLPVNDIVEFWLGAARGIMLQKVGLSGSFDLNSARRGLGMAVQALMGCDYFENFDKSL